jgi:aspartate/methionine/tyrosine aminotransferase
LSGALTSIGFSFLAPAGGFYIFTDFGRLGEDNSEEFAFRMMRQAGVACVPGCCFYLEPTSGRSMVRFCFAKESTTLEAASHALSYWLGRAPSARNLATQTSALVK